MLRVHLGALDGGQHNLGHAGGAIASLRRCLQPVVVLGTSQSLLSSMPTLSSAEPKPAIVASGDNTVPRDYFGRRTAVRPCEHLPCAGQYRTGFALRTQGAYRSRDNVSAVVRQPKLSSPEHGVRDQERDLRDGDDQQKPDDHRDEERHHSAEDRRHRHVGGHPLHHKTLRPTGGVIIPISITITATTPNQIGSKPSPVITGKTIGIVTTSIDSPSRNMPSTT